MQQKEAPKKPVNNKPSFVWKLIYLIVILIAIIAILILSYYIYLNLPRDPQPLQVETDPKFQPAVVSSVNQFYPNMKFNHNKLTYFIDPNCNEDRVQRMEQAFDEITKNVPLISFFKSEVDPDIEISCTNTNRLNLDKKHFVAGEGGAKEIIQTGNYNIITEGIILLYDNSKVRTTNCDYPNVEIHELLHVLGFDHSENKRSIMYPFIESCDQLLDKSIVTQLKTLYSQENLPDLYFDKLEVSKKGRYIDFDLTVKNSGSIKSGETIITILDGTNIIEQRSLGDIDFGAGITLTTTNMRLKRLNPDQINFIIDKENSIKELDEDNNVATITLEN